MLEDILKEQEQKARETLATNPGHQALLSDLRGLLAEAEACEFHDFLNEKYAAPKVELHRKFAGFAEEVMEGKYDN